MQPIPRALFLFPILLTLSMVCAGAQTDPRFPGNAKPPFSRLIAGEEFLPAAIRAQQADDFDNPAYAYVQAGEAAWGTREGMAGKSCQDCHGAGSGNSVRHAAASYPKYNSTVKQVITLETRINLCRRNALGDSALADGSEQTTAMAAYLRSLSRGLPMTPDVSGPAAAVFERGRELYNAKKGLLQLSCAQCHVQKTGQKFGADTLSQGHPLAYPAYSLAERRMIALHERFRMCNRLVRAEGQPASLPDYVALELYLSWRSKDLPITAPGVRP